MDKSNQDSLPGVEFKERKSEKRVDVTVNGKLFTSYAWPDTVMKPILYPVLTSAGTEITRGFPLKTRGGERADHPHHIGIWLNYGDVNGYDFWGNSYEIPANIRKVHCGKIKHLGIEKVTAGAGEGSMITKASWIDPFGNEVLAERTEYHFIAQGSIRIIDRITTLTATHGDVKMKDTKEGMFGIRVARQLELPLKDEVTLTDALGNPTKVKKMDNEGVTGNYRSSEGITGERVWGTRAKWMDLYGSIGSEKISLVISDHPKNLSYPTYWHARGYGLLCTNPFGVKDFTKGKEALNYQIADGKSLTLRYRVIVSSGNHLTDAQIGALSEQFAKKYQ
ncbi:hypothetical protein Dfri01_22370 [Dyadobacter frigoris]|nr:hypothetical protein Dfri01_22370 [Dyadobacter frigoris]